jgi:flagellar basal body-associated protein FliL
MLQSNNRIDSSQDAMTIERVALKKRRLIIISLWIVLAGLLIATGAFLLWYFLSKKKNDNPNNNSPKPLPYDGDFNKTSPDI